MPKAPTEVADVRDVADFHLHWPQFRPIANRAAGRAVLLPDERRVIGWLIALADRVGESDVRPPTVGAAAPDASATTDPTRPGSRPGSGS